MNKMTPLEPELWRPHLVELFEKCEFRGEDPNKIEFHFQLRRGPNGDIQIGPESAIFVKSLTRPSDPEEKPIELCTQYTLDYGQPGQPTYEREQEQEQQRERA